MPPIPTKKLNGKALDDIDYCLLRIVQEDCSLSGTQLSARLKERFNFTLGHHACINRIKELKNEGYIAGFHAILNKEKFGYNQICFLIVQMNTRDAAGIEDFLSIAKSESGVLEIHELAGDKDYIIKMFASVMEATALSRRLGQYAEVTTYAVGTIQKEGIFLEPQRR